MFDFFKNKRKKLLRSVFSRLRDEMWLRRPKDDKDEHYDGWIECYWKMDELFDEIYIEVCEDKYEY